MAFHAKALEVFTLAYQSIQNVDEEEDLEVGWRRQGSPDDTLALKFYLQAMMCHSTAFV